MSINFQKKTTDHVIRGMYASEDIKMYMFNALFISGRAILSNDDGVR